MSNQQDNSLVELRKAFAKSNNIETYESTLGSNVLVVQVRKSTFTHRFSDKAELKSSLGVYGLELVEIDDARGQLSTITVKKV